ncbi:uncharacterized protein LOC121867882 [Homarus americanus]|uniref:uncharacterized protein LOC121867882 n=1 Tax=Homarus americanus TaxID=6706 RepID=UPI001C46304D|nr:uncharacterized protein LOC121867882 [Homarus americanus]
MMDDSEAGPHSCYTFTLVLLLLLTHTTTPAEPGSGEEGVHYRLSPHLLSDNGSFVSEEDLQLTKPQVTACVWVRITYFRRPSVPLSIGSRDASVGDVSVGELKGVARSAIFQILEQVES